MPAIAYHEGIRETPQQSRFGLLARLQRGIGALDVDLLFWGGREGTANSQIPPMVNARVVSQFEFGRG